MASAKIKKGDKVVVLSGKDKGRHGEVTKSMPKVGKSSFPASTSMPATPSRRRRVRRAVSCAPRRRCTFAM